jgi:hypothetical protein
MQGELEGVLGPDSHGSSAAFGAVHVQESRTPDITVKASNPQIRVIESAKHVEAEFD